MDHGGMSQTLNEGFEGMRGMRWCALCVPELLRALGARGRSGSSAGPLKQGFVEALNGPLVD